MGKKYIALIPAYKPSELMSALVERLHRDGFAIVIVDDGSGGVATNISLKAAAE